MKLSKRELLRIIGLSPIAASTKINLLHSTELMERRIIPSSGKLLPVIGLGTSRVFDVKPNKALLEIRKQILEILLFPGGSMVDTSPMYGMAEEITELSLESSTLRIHYFLQRRYGRMAKMKE